VRRLREFLFVRHRHNWLLLLRFAVVGATGVLVNLLTLVIVKKLGPGFNQAIVPVPGTEFNVRWYHAYSTFAFLVANLWNFQLNRTWTFRTSKHARWWHEYWPFLAVGLLGQVVGLVLLTLLMHLDSPIHLSPTVLDDSTGFRTRLYWAQLIVIVVVTPISFVLNKLWTFAAVRAHHPDLADPSHAEAALTDEGPDGGPSAGQPASAGPGRRDRRA
jgi:putative flippase GtrA